MKNGLIMETDEIYNIKIGLTKNAVEQLRNCIH